MNNEDGMMNDSTRAVLRPRRAWPPAARTVAAIIAMAALALLAAACGGSPSSTGSVGSPSAVAYSHCMRSHGVTNYPDPGSNGLPPKGGAQHFGISSSRFQAAQRSCQHLLPTGGSFQQQAGQCELAGDCPPAVVQQMMTIDRKFAQCMRSHGVPNWPDPIIDDLSGLPSFRVSKAGITHEQTHSAPMSNTIAECQRLEGATLTFGLS